VFFGARAIDQAEPGSYVIFVLIHFALAGANGFSGMKGNAPLNFADHATMRRKSPLLPIRELHALNQHICRKARHRVAVNTAHSSHGFFFDCVSAKTWVNLLGLHLFFENGAQCLDR
jgi:hypothetical protein